MENGKNLIHSFNHVENCEGNFNGLTKREYFAALAMQGLLSNQTVNQILCGNNDMSVPDLIAEYSVNYAEALLVELSKLKSE